MMTVATRLFNGTVFAFDGTAVGKLVGLAYKVGGQWIDVTEPEDLNKLYELSTQSDLEIKLKFKGCHLLVEGTKGTAAITFSNGYTRSCPGTWQVGNFEFTGDWEAPWNSTAEARPTVPDAE
jgi:hypothetical protein